MILLACCILFIDGMVVVVSCMWVMAAIVVVVVAMWVPVVVRVRVCVPLRLLCVYRCAIRVCRVCATGIV